jgi:hypothetical protein
MTRSHSGPAGAWLARDPLPKAGDNEPVMEYLKT